MWRVQSRLGRVGKRMERGKRLARKRLGQCTCEGAEGEREARPMRWVAARRREREIYFDLNFCLIILR